MVSMGTGFLHSESSKGKDGAQEVAMMDFNQKIGSCGS